VDVILLVWCRHQLAGARPVALSKTDESDEVKKLQIGNSNALFLSGSSSSVPQSVRARPRSRRAVSKPA
jgi:hypothetical protein